MAMAEAAYSDGKQGRAGRGRPVRGGPVAASAEQAVVGMACSICGAPVETHFTRGALVACADPPRIYCHGRRLSLSPMQARIMLLLVQFGSVSFDELARLSKVNSLQGIFVATTGLRKRLPAGILILTRRRWGYVLEQFQ